MSTDSQSYNNKRYPDQVIEALFRDVGVTIWYQQSNCRHQPDLWHGICTYWTDDWDAVAATSEGIPCCPQCSNVGFQISRDEWWRAVDKYEKSGHPGYRSLIEWGKEQCFPDYDSLARAFKA